MTTKLFPGVTQEHIDNLEKAKQLKAAQEAMAEKAKKEKQRLEKEEKQKKKAHSKYGFSPVEKVLGGGILSTVSLLKNQLAVNIPMFLIGSLGWLIASQPRNDALFRDDYRFGEVHELPAWDERSYKQALTEAYNPIRDGKFDPHFWWYVNMAILLATTIYSLSEAKKRLDNAVNGANKQIDIMLEIEKLAKEHNLDATAAKKIIKIAPDIVKHMSKDSRVYFDMIMEGQIATDDENFINIATAIMVGHLKTHPEDMELVMSTFDERSIPKEVLAMQTQR